MGWLKTSKESIAQAREWKRKASEVLTAFGLDSSSKGGQAKAAANSKKTQSRNLAIKEVFKQRMSQPKAKRHKVVSDLAKVHRLAPYTINAILREK